MIDRVPNSGAGGRQATVPASVSKALLRPILAPLARRRARCLFVLSTGRVGTVTLTHLLELSPDVHAEHEPGPQFLQESRWAYEQGPWTPGEAESLLRTFVRTRLRPLLGAMWGARVYAECSNRLTFLASILAAGLPHSRFLFLHRNPADVVRSGMRRGWYRHHPWDPYRIRPRPTDPAAGVWESWGAFERCCWYWSATNQLCLEIAGSLNRRRIFTLSTDALFAPDGSGAERLFRWLGVGPVDHDEVLRIVTTRFNRGRGEDFPTWPEWSRGQKAALARIAGTTARRLGYASYVEVG